MKKSVEILGTNYTIRRVSVGQDETIDRLHYCGYCSGVTKEIVLLKLKTVPEWANEPLETIQMKERETLRHEIIHAFLNESGLGWNSLPVEHAWAKNEEMVDWIAIQFPKIHKAFTLVGCAED